MTLSSSQIIAGSSDSEQDFDILCDHARMHGSQGNLAEAKLCLKKIEDLLTDSQTSSLINLRYKLELGRLFVLEKTPSQARPLFLEAWDLAKSLAEDYYAIDAALMLSAIEPQKMKIEWTERARALAETSSQPRAKQCLGSVYSALGWLDFELRKYESSLEFFRRALKALPQETTKRDFIRAEWAVARLLRALNQIDEAFQIQSNLAERLKELGISDGLVFEELAECLQSLKRNTEAQPYFELAYKELCSDQWLADNNQGRLKRLKDFGKCK